MPNCANCGAYSRILIGDLCGRCYAESHQEGGKKYDKGKPRLDLIPPELIFAVGEILRYGAEEKGYGERNWEKGIRASRLFAACQRHLWQWWSGEDADKESGLPHLWHAATCLAMLLTTVKRHPNLDDRPTKDNKEVAYERS